MSVCEAHTYVVEAFWCLRLCMRSTHVVTNSNLELTPVLFTSLHDRSQGTHTYIGYIVYAYTCLAVALRLRLSHAQLIDLVYMAWYNSAFLVRM